jgi:hypothetical protein
MSEWWTYRPSDFLLFSARTYWRLFELHNLQWWPLQVPIVGLALGTLAWWWRTRSPRPLLVLMAAAWGFVAWAFHLQRYAGINWAASWFAAGFVLQALVLLALAAATPPSPDGGDRRPRLAPVLLLFTLLLYPLIGLVFGQPLVQAEVFGLAPDPTVLATLAVLALVPHHRRGTTWRLAWALPLLWCAASAITRWTMR